MMVISRKKPVVDATSHRACRKVSVTRTITGVFRRTVAIEYTFVVSHLDCNFQTHYRGLIEYYHHQQ